MAPRGHRRAFLWGAAFLLAAAPSLNGACTQADTVVSVHVRGNVPDVQQLQVTLTIAGQMRTLMIPQVPRPVSLPTSFTVQMQRSVQGLLQVAVVALDGAGTSLASGNGGSNNLSVGQTNPVWIDLTAAIDPGPDGGANDDGGDAAVSADTAGGSGGAGTGGAGTGGMAGTGSGGGSGDSGSGGMDMGGASTGGMGAGGEGTGGEETGGAGAGGTGPGGSAGGAGETDG